MKLLERSINNRFLVFINVILIITGCIAKPESARSVTLPSLNPIVKKVIPAVVNVKTSFVVERNLNNYFPFNSPNFKMPEHFKRFFKQPGSRSPGKFRNRGVGSGVIISKDGYILTNNHVVERASDIKVKLNNNKEYNAKVIGKDPKTDIALIKINAKEELPYANLGDSSGLNIGDWVIAIGNPFGLSHTVTAGIVSAKGRKNVNPSGRQGYYNFIQTDASINPGNSGGPLIDMKGRVVGINTAIIRTAQGIGFAIPINLAKSLIPQLKSKGRVTRSWIGIRIQRVTGDLAKSFGLDSAKGALVSDVIEGTPGHKAGLKAGDIIIKFDGKEIKDSSDLPWYASMAGVGKKVEVEIFRKGKTKTLKIKLEEMPDHIGKKRRLPRKSAEEKGVLGIKVRNIPSERRRSLGLDKKDGGVVVSGIDRSSRAYEAGLRRGYVILRLNDEDISGPEQFIKILKSVKKGTIVRMFVKVRSGSMFLAFKKQ